MVDTHTANNLLSFENAGTLLKTLLPRFPIVFGLPLKSLVLIYPSVRPSVRPSVHPVMKELVQAATFLSEAHQPDVDFCILEP